MGKKQQVFNIIFFGILAFYALFLMTVFIIGEVNSFIEPQENNPVTNIPVGPLRTITSLILPLIFLITFIFHIKSFFKSDLDAKQFKIEFYINLVLVIIVGLFCVMILFEMQIAMLILYPAISIPIVMALVVSIVNFFIGYQQKK